MRYPEDKVEKIVDLPLNFNPSCRSHQLRVHLAHIGNPILGDTLYAPNDIMSMSPRLCLHAQFLKFAHPATNEITVIESMGCDFFPKDFITEGFI